MPPAARLGDAHTCPRSSGGTIADGSPTVTINGKPAARLNDPCACADAQSFVGSGSRAVTINGRPAARLQDTTCHHGVISQGSPDVVIGDGGRGAAGAMATARTNAAPFVRA
jgi:uncharacterized Zn-binding protein involved in type VI secretion